MKSDSEEKIIEQKSVLENVKTNTNEEIIIEKNKKQVFTKNKVIFLISTAIILVLLLIISTIFAVININNTKIISNIKINGVDVEKLSKEEATEKLQNITNQKLEKNILIKSGEFEYEVKLSQIETNYNIDKAIEEAYNIGKSGNIFSNNFNILKNMISGKNINIEYTYNEELLNKILDDISSKIPEAVEESSYYIEEDKLIITKGKKGNSIDKEQLRLRIIDEILNYKNENQLNIEFIEKEPDSINIDKIYEEVHKEPKDAYYTENPFQIYPHVDGVDFDLEAAREILKEEKEEYEIELKITKPNVTTNQIGTEAFPDLLSSFSTRYDASNLPRTTNLKLAMNKLNGVVVAPGEICSYNQTLGKRTAEAGYKYAGGYAGGKVVQTLAGGICQISSTLYDAVVYANLDVIERHNHMFLAGYVGAGKDATVVYGSLDFKFKNTRKYPIMIKTSIGNGVAKVEIYGIKEEVEYDVDIVTNVLSYTPFKVIYEEDSSLAPGKEVVSQSGMNGCKSITYKVVKLNGVEVSRTVLSSDTYDPMNKIIRRGPQPTIETNTAPVEPTTPSEPVTPTEPTTPSEPVTPTEPTTPEEPVTPTEPTTPEEPTTPSEPVTPTEPTTTEQTGEPTNSNI